MRAAVTTGLEVAGMISFAFALGLLTAAWAGFVFAGVCLVVVGFVEAR